jgi:hypothetical protein
MAEKDDVKLKIKEKIAQLDKDSAKAYREQLKALNDNNAALDTYKNLLGDINIRIEDQLQGFAGLLEEIKGINEELEKEGKYVRDATKAFRGLESIASKLKNDQKGYTDLNLDQLKQEKSKLKILEDQFKEAAKQIQLRGAITDEEKAIVAAYEAQNSQFQRSINLVNERIKQEDKINKKLGVTGILLTGMSKIPIVGPLLKTNEALDAAKEKAKAGGNAFQSMGAGLANMGKSILSSLKDPLAVIGLMVAAFKGLLELGFKFDKQVTSLQKTLYLSKTEAEGMHKNFIFMQKSQTQLVDGYYTQLSTLQNQTDAANQLGTAFGAVSRVTNKEIQNQIKLTQQMGLSAEEGQALYVLARQNHMTQDDITKEVTSQVNSFKKQSGALLDSKKILQDVSKISGQLRLQYGNNVKQLVAATVQANKLGFSLEQTKKIAEGLLNFEESIENELSAELLIGRDLNLEQARLLALNGESAKATALIAENMGGSAGFASMNVISQEALAKALGMSADELANSIMYQENLSKLSKDDKKRLEDKLAYYRSIGDVEKAQQLERAAANSTNLDAALAAVDAETKFQAAVVSIKESLGAIVAGPAMKLANAMSEMLISGTGLYKVLGGVGILLATMPVTKLVMGLIQAAVAAGTMATSAAFGMSALTLGGAAALALIGGYAIMNGINSAADQAEARATKPAKANFNQGGIVGGNSFTGDNVGINVNSGEMVLTRREQAEFYNMIKRGGGMGDRNTPIVVNAMINDRVLATAMAGTEERYSNQLGSSRATSNHRPS